MKIQSCNEYGEIRLEAFIESRTLIAHSLMQNLTSDDLEFIRNSLNIALKLTIDLIVLREADAQLDRPHSSNT